MSSQRNRNRGANNRGAQQSASQESGIWQRARDELQTIVQLVNAANDTGREVVEQDRLMTSDAGKDSRDQASEIRKQDDLLRKGVKDIELLNSTLAQTIERLEIYRALKEEQERNALPVPGSARSSRDTQGTGRTTGRAGTREQRERERHADSERQRAEREKEREREREKEKELREQKEQEQKEQREQKEQKEQKEAKEQRERDKEQRDKDRDKDRESQRAERERERERERDKDREARDRDRGRDRERERDRDRDRSTRDRDRSDRDRERDRDRGERADRDRGDRDRGDRDRGDRADRERERERDKDSREKDPYEFDGPGDEMDIEPTAATSAVGRKAGSSSNSSGNRDSVPPRGGDRDTPVKADSVEPQPLVANAGSSMSSAAQRSRVTFVKGQDVVFKPKPANASDSAEWFLGKVQQVLGEGKSRRYKVKDEDPDVAPEQRQEYRTSASSMIALPPAGQELWELEPGKTVLALYPDSTTFYKAEVMSTNKSLDKVNLRFEGEENSGTLQEVERRFVVEYRN